MGGLTIQYLHGELRQELEQPRSILAQPRHRYGQGTRPRAHLGVQKGVRRRSGGCQEGVRRGSRREFRFQS
eukprot:1193004-Prorocentrum_minimum.AAC.2